MWCAPCASSSCAPQSSCEGVHSESSIPRIMQAAAKASERAQMQPQDQGDLEVGIQNGAAAASNSSRERGNNSVSVASATSGGEEPRPTDDVADIIAASVDFRVEMWQSRLQSLKVDMLASVWHRKVEWALRTGTAIFLSSMYAVLPIMEQAKWQNYTVFAPVLAIAGVCGPSVGETLHHCWHFITGAVLGAACGFAVNESVRRIEQPIAQHWLTFVILNVVAFFLVTRPGAPLDQRRTSTVVLVVAVFEMNAKGYSLPWFYPLTLLVPIVVACVSAVLAVLLPYPCTAVTDWRKRAEFQALTTRALIAEQYDAASTCTVAATSAAAQLVGVLTANLVQMMALKPAIEMELLFNPSRFENLCGVTDLFQQQLLVVRAIQSALDGAVASDVHRKFRKITDAPWQRLLKAIATATDDAVALDGYVEEEVLRELESARAELDLACERARKETLYKRCGSVRTCDGRGKSTENLHIEHCQRIAMHFFGDRFVATVLRLRSAKRPQRTSVLGCLTKTLAMAAISACSEDLEEDKGNVASSSKKKARRCEWFRCPTGDAAKGGIKKALTLAIISLFAFIPDVSAHFPEYAWAAIAACFIFSDSVGSSVSTGMHRITGTLFGGVFGLLAIDILDDWRPGYVISLVLWTVACALFRGSPTHGYLATVAAFSAPIMMIGALEIELGLASEMHVERIVGAEYLVLHRTKMIAIGAVIYMAVENLLWPSSARDIVRSTQASILDLLRTGLGEALQPFQDRCHVGHHEADSPLAASTVSAVPHESRLDDPTLAGLSAINRCKSLLHAADEEPLFWRKPFPRHEYEQVLLEERKAFRVIVALHDAARAANVWEVAPEACHLIASYARAADNALKSAFAEISAPAAARALGLAQSASLRSAASIVTPLAELAAQSAKFKIGMSHYLLKITDEHREVVHSHMHSQRVALSTQTVFFLCLEFSKTVVQLSERLRTVSMVESSALNI
eukprot:TRINITY_DN14460_c0_g1_i2.p1 TRINITY_DN14460_c0_g1~~TRINITY_DN14460_c0_g1_i2.p1  ORF type:complete len:970 (+),score=191.21 TRINITY_DN14460_c0_g1_i2:82-2991(+)